MPNLAIELKNVSKSYYRGPSNEPNVALDKITLNIKAGCIFGLLGPNGAGKSTLINILAGLVIKSSGNVIIWGFDQDTNPRQSRAAIGVMPQELNLDPFFSPFAALEVQAGLYGVPRKDRITNEILDLVGLKHKANAYARTLSGGMRRRLLLAKALVHRPEILVLDEPTAGVDIELRQMLWENVIKLNKLYGTTIILTTHYLEEAEKMCDELAILKDGQILTVDKTSNLLDQMDARSLIVTSQNAGKLSLYHPKLIFEYGKDHSLVISYKTSEIDTGGVIDIVKQMGIKIEDVKTVQPDLQDVFLDMISNQRSSKWRDF